ncbi:MAG TPA: hypothetical protein VF918_08325 [Anaerolineales bacterium]
MDRERRHASPLALFRKVRHTGGIRLEQGEASSFAQAGIQPVEEKIKVPGYRIYSG